MFILSPSRAVTFLHSLGQGRSSGDVRVTSGLALNPDIITAPGGGGGGRGGRGGGGRGGPGGLGTSLALFI